MSVSGERFSNVLPAAKVGEPRAEVARSRWTVWLVVAAPVILYTLILRGLLSLQRTLALSRTFHLDLRGMTALFLGEILLTELLVGGALLLYLGFTHQSLADIGLARLPTRSGFLVGVLLALAYAGLTLMNPAIGPHATEVSLFKLWGVIVGVVGGAIEECVFRGLVMNELQQARVPVVLQVIISAATFALIHGFSSFIGLIFPFVLGLALAGVYLLSRRSLISVIVSHGLINILIEPWLMLWFVSGFMPAS